MALQHTRWIFDERDFAGSTKRLSDVFIRKTLLSMTWVRSELEGKFGFFPKPKFRPLSPDPSNRDQIISALRAEYEDRRQDRPSPVV